MSRFHLLQSASYFGASPKGYWSIVQTVGYVH